MVVDLQIINTDDFIIDKEADFSSATATINLLGPEVGTFGKETRNE